MKGLSLYALAAVLLLASCAGGPSGPSEGLPEAAAVQAGDGQDAERVIFIFWGHCAFMGGADASRARVEWRCNSCALDFPVVYTDEGGWYTTKAPGDHSTHCVTGCAGYTWGGQGIQMLGCGPSPCRVDFNFLLPPPDALSAGE